MKYSQSILALFATAAVAQPHKQLHQHKAKHVEHLKARDPAIAWVTEYEYTTEVVPVTATIWVSEGFVPPPETTSSSSAGKNTVPAQFFQPASKRPSSTTTTTSVLPTTTSVYVAPIPTTPLIQPTIAPVVEIPSSAPSSVVQPVPTTLESVYVAPAVTTAAPVTEAAPAPSSDSSSGSTGGECSKGSSCTGDITHYDTTGYGACGWQSDGKVENVLALSHLLMGTQSNGNPYCGKTVTVKLNGKSIVAKVVDKCMGCEKHAIDLSEAAFSQLEDMSVGRTQVEWYFN